MVHNKDRYRKNSYCKTHGWIPDPTYDIREMAIAYLPNPWQDKHPELEIGKVFYDDKGWKHTILARLILLSKTWVKKVICPVCNNQCRGRSPYKTDERKAVKKERITIEKVGVLGVIPVSREVESVKPELPGRLQLAKDYPDDYAKLSPKGRPKDSILYEEEKNKILDFFNRMGDFGWGNNLGRSKSEINDQIIRERSEVMKHLQQRGFRVSEERLIANDYYIKSGGFDSDKIADDGYIYSETYNKKTQRLFNFDDVIEFLDTFEDKKRQHLIKYFLAQLLSSFEDKNGKKISVTGFRKYIRNKENENKTGHIT